MASDDVTVFGAGVFGLSVAWACAARGARVRVVDPAGLAGGASGGVVGALAPHAPDDGWTPVKAFQLRALLMAPAFWAGVADRAGTDPGYRCAGRLQPVANEAALARAQARAGAARRLWAGQADWRVIRATGAEWEPESPTGWLVQDTLTAALDPRAACPALATAIRAAGGTFGPEPGPRPGAQVHATGWQGLLALSAELGREVGGGEKGQALVLGAPPKGGTGGRAGSPPWVGRPVIQAPGLFVVPHGPDRIAVGSTSERDWDDPSATDGQLDALHARAVAMLPALQGLPVIDRWAGVRPRAASRMPILGAHPGRPGQFIANGGFKIGFALAPLVGLLMADLVLDGQDAIPDAFRLA